jgi:hypothetical protein
MNATKLGRVDVASPEPIPASEWATVRAHCNTYAECRYPWCCCADMAEIEAETADRRGRAEGPRSTPTPS